jgi:cytochrome P450
MVFQDPPDHTRLRSLVNKAFTSRVVEAMRLRIQATVEGLLDAVQSRRQMDLIHDFAYPLPAITIAEMLGVPPEARNQFKGWADDVVAFLGTGRAQLDILERGQQSVLALTEWLRNLIAQHRRQPKADLLSLLISAEEQGDVLSEMELVGICISLLTAGHETTTNLIGNGLLALLQHPAQQQQLQENPDLIVAATEELLRYNSPVQRNWRVIKENIELGGQQMSRGQLVFAMLGAANRDPAQFPDPDRLDFDRRENRHVAFGYGIHFCVGAPLARLEGQIAINTILHRLPGLRLVNERPVWLENMAFRGLKSLPVVF